MRYAIHEHDPVVQIVLKDIFSAGVIDVSLTMDSAGISGLAVPVREVMSFRGVVAEVISVRHVLTVFFRNDGQRIIPHERGQTVLLPLSVDESVDIFSQFRNGYGRPVVALRNAACAAGLGRRA
jgi:hypothetical protein